MFTYICASMVELSWGDEFKKEFSSFSVLSPDPAVGTDFDSSLNETSSFKQPVDKDVFDGTVSGLSLIHI